MDVLAPDDAGRVAVQEADQTDAVVRGARDDILDRGHRRIRQLLGQLLEDLGEVGFRGADHP